MATNNILALLTTTSDVGDLSFSNWGKGRVVREIERALGSLSTGTNTGSMDVQLNPAFAAGALVIASGTGAVGGTIGGQLVTATWATSDANSADLVAAAIIAHATAGVYATAFSRVPTGTVTIATGSGVITAIIGGIPVSVTWATSDTATATALAAAINATAQAPVVASSAAGVVTVYYLSNPGSGVTNTAGNSVPLQCTGTGASVSAATLTGGGTNANVLVMGKNPGSVGNGITLVASGTGVTAPTGARLVGGLGAIGNSFAC